MPPRKAKASKLRQSNLLPGDRNPRSSGTNITLGNRVGLLNRYLLQRALIQKENNRVPNTTKFMEDEAVINSKSKELEYVSDEKPMMKTKGLVKLREMIGSPSANGETWLATVPTRDGGGDINVALKKLPLFSVKEVRIRDHLDFSEPRYAFIRTDSIDDSSPYTTTSALQHESAVEIVMLEVSRLLIEQGITINLPLSYDFRYSPHCTYSNPEIRNLPEKDCLLVISELASGDFNTWLSKRRTHLAFRSAAFQILIGLHVIYHYCGVVHRDTHTKNILFVGRESKKERFRLHRLEKQLYFQQPDLGQVFYLWDFQFAYRPGILDAVVHKQKGWREPKEIEYLPEVAGDYERLFSEEVLQTAIGDDVKMPLEMLQFSRRMLKYAKEGRSILQVLVVEFADWIVDANSINDITRSKNFIEMYDMTKVVRPTTNLCKLGIFLPGRSSARCDQYAIDLAPEFLPVSDPRYPIELRESLKRDRLLLERERSGERKSRSRSTSVSSRRSLSNRSRSRARSGVTRTRSNSKSLSRSYRSNSSSRRGSLRLGSSRSTLDSFWKRVRSPTW